MPSATIYTKELWVNHHFMILFQLQTNIADTSKYWPFAWEYSIWNATVAALQFWTEDLKPLILNHAIEWVYAAYFYSDHTQQIWNLPEEILFGHFMTTLKDAFEIKLTQEDEGNESGSENFHFPTPLSRAPRVYHVSKVDALSFNLANFGQSPTTPEQHAKPSSYRNSCCSLTCCHLVFTSSDDENPVRPSEWHSPHCNANARSPTPREADVSSSVHHTLCHHIMPTRDQFLTEVWDDVDDVDTTHFDKHFPTAPFDDDVWNEEQIQVRCLCIHERHDVLNHQCSYPCPYDSTTFSMGLLQYTPQNEAVFNYKQMDFSDISSDLPDIIMATDDNDIPDFDDASDASLVHVTIPIDPTYKWKIKIVYSAPCII